MMFFIRTLIFLELFYSVLGIFYAGVDISHVARFEQGNVVYRDYDGQPYDLFNLIKRHRMNCIRLRLFTSSEQQALSDPYNFSSTLKHTLKLALRAKKK